MFWKISFGAIDLLQKSKFKWKFGLKIWFKWEKVENYKLKKLLQKKKIKAIYKNG